MTYNKVLRCFFKSIIIAISLGAVFTVYALSTINAQSFSKLTSDNYLSFLRDVIHQAHRQKKAISLKGASHTQGGHTQTSQGITLDLSALNRLEMISPNILRAQTGANWKQVLDYLNVRGLSVDIMQSDYDFSIGGTVSANVHGWQLNKPPLISSILGFHLLTAQGEVLYCSRDHFPDLFKSTIGGYGLFGIILDVDFKVVLNDKIELKQWEIDQKDFLNLFEKQARQNPKASLFFGRLSLESDNFLQKILFYVYEIQGEKADYKALSSYGWSQGLINRVFGYTLNNDFFKKCRWFIESKISKFFKTFSRNQLLYHSTELYLTRQENQIDLLQEYFIPVSKFPTFLSYLQSLEAEIKPSLMNITLRHVLSDTESLLSYADQEMICFVMFFRGPKNQRFEDQLQKIALKLTDKALSLRGRYYLPYRPFQTKEQFQKAYPAHSEFKRLKQRYDPEMIFMNQFYKNYFE